MKFERKACSPVSHKTLKLYTVILQEDVGTVVLSTAPDYSRVLPDHAGAWIKPLR